MSHAYDRRIDLGDGCEQRWLRITVDFEDEDGEPVSRGVRCVALEDEDTGIMWALTKAQAEQLATALRDGVKVIAS